MPRGVEVTIGHNRLARGCEKVVAVPTAPHGSGAVDGVTPRLFEEAEFFGIAGSHT